MTMRVASIPSFKAELLIKPEEVKEEIKVKLKKGNMASFPTDRKAWPSIADQLNMEVQTEIIILLAWFWTTGSAW